MTAGVLLVCTALVLFLANQREDVQAGNAAKQVLSRLQECIEEAETEMDEPGAVYETEKMTEAAIDGYAYIGYLSIPALKLDLPVMSEWDYTRLKISPCRYVGSTKTENLVLCAHNYARHFGNLKNLTVGDEVNFTDMDGVTIRYTVILVEMLEPAAVEKMRSEEHTSELQSR